MSTLTLRSVFLLAACIIFALAAVAPAGLPARPNLVALGLLCVSVALFLAG